MEPSAKNGPVYSIVTAEPRVSAIALIRAESESRLWCRRSHSIGKVVIPNHGRFNVSVHDACVETNDAIATILTALDPLIGRCVSLAVIARPAANHSGQRRLARAQGEPPVAIRRAFLARCGQNGR